jgi:small multidrug resistance pump
MTAWMWMSGAILCEIAGTMTLTYSNGLTRGALTAVTAVLYVATYVCLSRALAAGIEISVAYAVWSGLGTAAVAVLGAWLFGEALGSAKVLALLLIVGGVALLNLNPASPPVTFSAAEPANVPTPIDPVVLTGRRPQ